MTYREQWEQRIHEMTLEEFMRFINSSNINTRFDDAKCAYCKGINGGECPSHEDDGCIDDLVYLAAEVGA